MTGSPVISVNLTSQKNPANLNYHMRLRKVKRSSLVFGFRWAQKTKPCFVTLGTFFSFLFPLSSFLLPLSLFLFPLSSFLLPLSSFLFPLSSFFFNFLLAPSSFLIPLSSFLFPLSYCRSFSVLKILTASWPGKGSKCHKMSCSHFLSPESKPNAKLETYKAF